MRNLKEKVSPQTSGNLKVVGILKFGRFWAYRAKGRRLDSVDRNFNDVNGSKHAFSPLRERGVRHTKSTLSTVKR